MSSSSTSVNSSTADRNQVKEKICLDDQNESLNEGIDSIELEKQANNEAMTKGWESEQIRLKSLCVLEDVEPWEIHRFVDSQSTLGLKDVRPLKYIAGTDISFVKGDATNACAAVVVVELPNLEVIYEDISMVELTAPYIPGFLAFREAEFIVKKFDRLQNLKPEIMPQAIMVDGNGILHAREFGLACHIGVQLGIPTVGVAKTLYYVDGIEKNEEHQNKIKMNLKKGGDTFPLISNSGKTLGVTLRSCDKTTKPIYVSPGHNISLETAVWLVQLCCKYRIPEPVRQADIKSREHIRDKWKSNE